MCFWDFAKLDLESGMLVKANLFEFATQPSLLRHPNKMGYCSLTSFREAYSN